MTDRTRFDLEGNDPFQVEIDGERFGFRDCYEFAELSYMDANIHLTVFKTTDQRFLKIIIVADEGERSAYGIAHGWYVARFIDCSNAEKIRQSWAVLRKQPPEPSGPWA